MSSNTDTRADRKDRYEHALSVVDENTTDVQPPGIAAGSLWNVLTASVGMDATDAHHAVRAAFENGDLFRWTDRDETVRY